MNQAIKKISKIRRSNLDLLRKRAKAEFKKQYPEERYTNEIFCNYIGISKDLFYQLRLPKYKPIFSEKYARRIEEKAELPLLWMDKKREDIEFNDIYFDSTSFINGLRAISKFTEKSPLLLRNREAEESLYRRIAEHINIHGQISFDEITDLVVEITKNS